MQTMKLATASNYYYCVVLSEKVDWHHYKAPANLQGPGVFQLIRLNCCVGL
jgi:hypothetical protein